MKRLKSFLGNLLFAAAVTALLLLVLSVAKGETPSLFGYRVLWVVTSSMEPAIPEETCILIRETDPDTLETGDIITFVSRDPSIYGYYNTHRIWDIYEDEAGTRRFVTKGDANAYPDDYDVSEEDVVGSYVRELPFGKALGKLLVKLNDRNVYFLVVILPLVLCLLSYVWQLLHLPKEEDEEENDKEDGI